MNQKTILVLVTSIISVLLLSACNQLEEQKPSKELAKKITTRAGELTLKYEDGKAVLSGTLKRSTPCVNWTVRVGGTKDLPRSEINIRIFDSNKDVICIQMVGEPQEINEIIEDVSKNTKYIINFEDKIVFEGKINN